MGKKRAKVVRPRGPFVPSSSPVKDQGSNNTGEDEDNDYGVEEQGETQSEVSDTEEMMEACFHWSDEEDDSDSENEENN